MAMWTLPSRGSLTPDPGREQGLESVHCQLRDHLGGWNFFLLPDSHVSVVLEGSQAGVLAA